MTKITTDFAGTETKAVAIERVTEILEWWGFDLDSFASWAEIRAAFNELIATPIADGELASSFITKLNAANDFDAVIGVVGLNDEIAKAGFDNLIYAILFSTSEPGIWLDFSDPSTLFQDSAGTTPVTVASDPVGNASDKSGNDNHAAQATVAARPTYVLASNGKGAIWRDGVDDELSFDLSSITGDGFRAVSTPYGHQIDNGVPITETTTPQLLGTKFIAREGSVTETELSRVSQYLDGDRQYFATQTYDLTLANLRMYMTNAETPVVRCIGYNGVETTVTLGANSDSAKDLGAAGLTAPATVLFPMVTDDTALVNFTCYSNQLTGSIPSLATNTSLVTFTCSGNQLTGSIPDLSANTSLEGFTCSVNQLTGSIPDLSANTALVYFYGSVNQLTGSIPDLSANTALVYFTCASNQLTGSIPSLSANTSLVNFYCGTNQIAGWAGGTLPASLANFQAQNNALPEATVDALLAALDTAGASNGTCKLEGGTNAAPSASGEASVTSLRGRGWTVTVTGGF